MCEGNSQTYWVSAKGAYRYGTQARLRGLLRFQPNCRWRISLERYQWRFSDPEGCSCVLNNQPCHKIELAVVVYLLIFIRQDEAAGRLQSRRSPFAECRGDRINSS